MYVAATRHYRAPLKEKRRERSIDHRSPFHARDHRTMLKIK